MSIDNFSRIIDDYVSPTTLARAGYRFEQSVTSSSSFTRLFCSVMEDFALSRVRVGVYVLANSLWLKERYMASVGLRFSKVVGRRARDLFSKSCRRIIYSVRKSFVFYVI